VTAAMASCELVEILHSIVANNSTLSHYDLATPRSKKEKKRQRYDGVAGSSCAPRSSQQPPESALTGADAPSRPLRIFLVDGRVLRGSAFASASSLPRFSAATRDNLLMRFLDDARTSSRPSCCV